MKLLPLLLLLMLSLSTKAQIKKGVFYTNINNAKKVLIENTNGEINIQKADSVFIGKIIINVTNATRLFLIDYGQNKDSSGLYITVMKFSNPDKLVSMNVDVFIEFNSPYDSAIWHGEGGGMQGEKIWGFPTKKYARIQGDILFSGSILTLTVKSKEEIFSKIYGIDGAYN